MLSIAIGSKRHPVGFIRTEAMADIGSPKDDLRPLIAAFGGRTHYLLPVHVFRTYTNMYNSYSNSLNNMSHDSIE